MYNNSIGSFITDIFGKSRSQKEVETLTNLAYQPAVISPMIYIIPVIAVGIFGVIYFTMVKK